VDIDLIIVKKDNIEFQIKDSGIGISKENIQRITEPFYQADQSISVKGFGLGLTICKKIIEFHKGKLTIESEKEKGSCFVLHLPIN
jgi:signal transduction histidine kinase